MDEAERQAIRKRTEKATRGPWRVANDNRGTEYFPFWVIGGEDVEDGEWSMELHVGHKCDADFIAQARAVIPKLLDEVGRHDAEMKTMGDLIHSKRKENERLQEHADNLERQLEQMTDNRDEMKQKRNKWYADAYELRKERDEWKAKTEQAQAKLNDIDRYGTQNERDWQEKAERLKQRHQLILAKSIIPFDERKNIDPYDVIMDMGTVAEGALRGWWIG